MVSDCGAALDEIRYHPRSLSYHGWFAAERFALQGLKPIFIGVLKSRLKSKIPDLPGPRPTMPIYEVA
jgi:hypothetical protein